MENFDLTKFVKGPLLGQGGFGEVFQYKWKDTKSIPIPRDVIAVKIFECLEAKLKEREVEILQLTHPNMVTFLGWNEDSRNVYLVMEMCNENLKTYLNRNKKRPDESQMRFFCLQLAEGMEFLHSNDCAHRDLKLDNVLVSFPTKINPWKYYKRVSLKLADFGLARIVGDKASKSTTSLVGNRKHAAPEVIQLKEKDLKEAKYDAKAADVFSLGTLFHLMLTGNVPFDEYQMKRSDLDVIPILNKAVPLPNMRPLLINMLVWTPDQRYHMCDVVRDSFLETEKKERNTMVKRINNFAKGMIDPIVKNRQAKIGIATNHTLIVLVGPSGAGKTSTIKHLMGQREMKQSAFVVSNRSSQTRETFELRLRIESENVELQHISLGIVDTPGLDDTEGKDQDARNMACMETFLNTHESLQTENGVRKYPNLVLFVIKGDGNRDIGKKSQFAMCLKQLLCDDLHLTDGKNLIIVLTHALSIEQNPLEWIETAQSKKKAIEDFVYKVKGWKVPVIFLDNKPPPRMRKAKDWTVFPDNTAQPLNLFNSIADEVLGPKGDLIGKRAIREYFQGLHNDKIRSKVAFTVAATKSSTKKKYKRNDQEDKFYKHLKDFEFPDTTCDDDDSSDDSDEEEEQGSGDEVSNCM